MAEMKFKFTIQPYQTEAVDSVVNVFAGQPFNDRFTYRRDVDISRILDPADGDPLMGFANAKVELTSQQLLGNIRKMQARNNIKLSDKLTGSLGACSLDVEMETGTGKTYVYIKTMFELNKRYGWSKFIVVVPSIAIREGIHKSFGTMQDHFMEHYGKKARFFIYDSKNLAEIDNFSQSADINVMIINIQAFNARGKDARKIRTELDDFGSRRPIDVIKANRPIVILDEPQKMGGTATQESLKEFNPLFCLNYSATHKQHHNLVYVLDALDAYNKRLVKRIEVKGFDIKNLRGTDRYLFLESIVISPKKPPMARLEFEIGYDKSINRETRIVGVDDDLYALSKNMEQYKGFRISEVDPIRRTVSFTNGEIIHVGEVTGDVSEADLRRVQIRETIRSHFEKEKELFARGIKTLSLFFIDEVAKYRKYDEEGNEINSEYGEFFEQECRTTEKRKKVRSVMKARGTSGKHMGKPPYGYRSDPQDKDHWIIDEDAAPVVKRIFDMTIEGIGPCRIARILEQDKVLTVKALYAQKNGKPLPERPYHWIEQSVVNILERMEYTGCVCNFKTYSKSYKLKKRIPNALEDMFILPDTQEAIVPQAQWDRVQELRKNKRRITKGERQGLFSGLAFCPDCGGKLHFGTCKSFEGHQDRYVCSHYKSGRGTCSAHYIREEVLRDVVLERIRAVTEYSLPHFSLYYTGSSGGPFSPITWSQAAIT